MFEGDTTTVAAKTSRAPTTTASAVTTDIYFVDGNGQRFAALIGVHNHALART